MSGPAHVTERRRLAALIRQERAQIAGRVANAVFARVPLWRDQVPGARRDYLAEAEIELDTLAASVEVGTTDGFLHYARWVARALESRGVPRDEVQRHLEQLAAALSEILTPAQAGPALELVSAARGAVADAERRERSRREDALGEERGEFRDALLGGRRHEALALMRRALAVHDPVDVYVAMVQETMDEIGLLWETNRISVAQEHLATSLVQYVLAHVYDELPRPGQHAGRAILCAAEHEEHQLGAHLVADALELGGWSARYLGGPRHAREIVAEVRGGCELLGISAAMLAHVPGVRTLIERVRGEVPNPPAIIVGGAAFRLVPELALEVGADAFAPDARAALVTAERYIPS